MRPRTRSTKPTPVGASLLRPPDTPVRIVRKHHVLVRISHWLTLPLLGVLTLSGLAIYWAAPVFRHAPDAVTGSTDYVADLGNFLSRHLPGAKTSPTFLYDHL